MITKEEITGMIGAAIFMVLLLVILLFSFFTLAAPSDDLGGIPVMFGNIEEAGGYEEPPMEDITPEEVMEIPAPQNTPSEVPLIAQTEDPSIVIKEQKRKEEEEKARQEEIRREAERRRQAEAERKRREEEARKKEAINKQMSDLFDEAANANRGETEGSGTQGVSTGSSDQGAKFGEGGIGLSLKGRGFGSGGPIYPDYPVEVDGIVVVSITVDPQGKVTHAEQGKGTVAASELVKEAIKAAYKTKFTPLPDRVTPQYGTITYNFKLIYEKKTK